MDTPYAMVIVGAVASTQDVARSHLEESGRPVLVLARRQTAGRGRTGNQWESAPRALAASLATQIEWPATSVPLVSLVAGLVARRSISSILEVDTSLKWPNDLVAGSEKVAGFGKVAGILVEVAGSNAVIGFGANLWWPDPPEGYAALVRQDPGVDIASEIADGWARGVLAELARPAPLWPRDEYRAACITLGQQLVWEPDGAGTALDIDADGGLVVATTAGNRTLRSGSVETVRPTTLAPESTKQRQGRE